MSTVEQDQSELTEGRARFEAARKKLGLTLKATASRMQVSPKTVEIWLYDRRRDIPHLAVMLIEAWADLADFPRKIRLALAEQNKPKQERNAERNMLIIKYLQDGINYSQIAVKFGLSRQSISNIAKQACFSEEKQQAMIARRAEITTRNKLLAGQKRKLARRAELTNARAEILAERERKLAEAAALVESGLAIRRAALKTGAPLIALNKRVATLVRARRAKLRETAVAAVAQHGTYIAGERASGLSYTTVKLACKAAGLVPTKPR